MWRGPSIGSPPSSIRRALLVARIEMRSPGWKTSSRPASKVSPAISIVPEYGITLSREDASNLAQAKAANYCGQFIVMREFGISPSDISRLFLAGGFANYVDVDNAVEIGFLAPVSPDRVVKSGNAAAQGAREVLLSQTRRRAAEEFVKRIEHIELETTPDFFEIFVEGCQFKPMPARFE